MRTIIYAVLNETTGTKTIVGASGVKANEKLAEMQKTNPNENYRIVYKWFSF